MSKHVYGKKGSGEIPPVVMREWLLWTGFAPWWKKKTGKTMDFPEFLKLRVEEAKREARRAGIQ